MRFELRGKRYDLRFVKRLKNDRGDSLAGQCDFAKQQLRILVGQSPEEELDTIIHEVLHACLPTLSEKAVAETASGVSTVLLKLGYRPSSS